MRILGIDPGLERVGFGLIERDTQHSYHARNWGLITTPRKDSEAGRLYIIHKELTELIQQLKPDIAAVEKVFFFRNAKTLIPVSQARGVILLVLHTAGVPYYEYTPMQVKMNMTGYGKSDKKEIQDMVQRLLSMDETVKSDDAADALAVALSCAYEQGPIQLTPFQAS